MIFVDPRAVARYQALALRHPKLYRFRVIATALFGDAALTALQLFPLAFILGVPLLFYSHPWFYWGAGFAFLLWVWLLRPTWKVTGRELTREDAPALFAELDSLRQALQVSGTMHVMVDDEFNASAGEVRGFFGLLGSTRVLTLGVPLLATLTREQILAVVAHEFGHFSRRHGRFGHWLYRARAGWLAYADADDTNAGILDKSIRWYGEQFVPHFSALSFVHSRQCEYEADADAASVVGAAMIATALSRTAILATYWGGARHRAISQWQRESVILPPDFFQRVAVDALAWEQTHRSAAEATAATARAHYTDTHPALAERLAALNAAPVNASHSEPGGAFLLGRAWNTIMVDMNSRYAHTHSTAWRAAHHHFHQIVAPITQSREENVGAELTRIAAIAELDPQAAYGDMQNLFRTYPHHVDVAYRWWSMQLDRIEADAASIFEARLALETLFTHAPIYRRKISQQLIGLAEREGDIARAKTWLHKLTLNNTSRANVSQDIITRVQAGKGAPQGAASALTRYLGATIAGDAVVRAAWLFHESAPLLGSREGAANRLAVHLLYLELDPDALKAAAFDEDAFGEMVGTVLRKALTPADEILVQTLFSTEAQPPELKTATPFFKR